MKKRETLQLTISIVILLLISFTFNTCKIKDPTDGVKIVLNLDLIKTKIAVQVVDASTNLQISDEHNAIITISGENKNEVVDISGHSSVEYKLVNGFVTLGLDPDYGSPSTNNQKNITLVVKANGYISTSSSLFIGQEGTIIKKIRMVNIDNPPPGVDIVNVSNIGTASNDEVNEDIEISTPMSNASISIPKGTILKTSDGTGLNGSLNLMLAHFSNQSDEALSSFPGGLMTNISYENDVSTPTTFYSAGFVAIELGDNNGNHAAIIEGGPLLMKMVVDPNTLNPKTGNPVAIGDEWPLWSYNPENGYWKYEHNIELAESPVGEIVGISELNHLSSFNFDWPIPIPEPIPPIPPPPPPVPPDSITSIVNPSWLPCFPLNGVIRAQDDNSIVGFISFWVCPNTTTFLINMPSFPYCIYWDTTPYLDFSPNPLCNTEKSLSHELFITYTGSPSNQLTIDITGYCQSNPDIEVRPSFGVWYRLQSEFNWNWAEMTNGVAIIPFIEIGEEYVVGTYFDGTFKEWTIDAPSTGYVHFDITLTDDICSDS